MSLPRTDFIRHLYLGHVTRSSRKTGRTLGHMPRWNEIYLAGLHLRPEEYATNMRNVRTEKLSVLRLGFTG